MLAKMARSAPRSPFGVPDVPAAIHASRGSCGKAEKSARIHAPSGVIWGIPNYNSEGYCLLRF